MQRYDLLPSRVLRAIQKQKNGVAGAVRRRRKKKSRTERQRVATVLPTVEQIGNAENLILTYYRCKQNGGNAAGPDGVTYDALGHREVCDIMRGLSREVLADLYQPSKARRVAIPKRSGRGTRTLSIRSITSRVVASALNEAMSSYWATVFLPCSFGFRPDTGVWDLLLRLEHIIVQQGCPVIGLDDIYQAFDEVCIGNVMDAHAEYVGNVRLLTFIEHILRGSEGNARTKGIDQGDPYSPTALNVLLHHVLDDPFGKIAANPLLLRYADDLVWAGHSAPKVRNGINYARALLFPTGLTLKGQPGTVTNLRDHKAGIEVLGLTLRLEGNAIRYRPGRDTWVGLAEGLVKAHRAVNPPAAAEDVVKGWITAVGPTLEGQRVERMAGRILKISVDAGFRELSDERIRTAIHSSRSSWTTYRGRYASRGAGSVEGWDSHTAAGASGDRRTPRGFIGTS